MFCDQKEIWTWIVVNAFILLIKTHLLMGMSIYLSTISFYSRKYLKI